MKRCENCKYLLSNGVDYEGKKACYLKLKAQKEPYTREQALEVYVDIKGLCEMHKYKEESRNAERTATL